MIHNPTVNEDLQSQGCNFIMDTEGNQLIPWENITSEDVVVTPAFGTTIKIKELLESKGVSLQTYDTTCPFVTRLEKSESIGKKDYSIIIHGKHNHEETRALFRTQTKMHPLIIRDLKEAKILAEHIAAVVPKKIL